MMKKTIIISCLLTLCALTTNAQNWKAVNFPFQENINGISFVNEDTAFLITKQGKVVRTFDGFESFDIFEAIPNVSLEDVYFINSNVGFICGSKGTFAKTTDGGYTFENLNITDSIPWFFDIEMFDEKHGMLIGMTREKETPLGGLAFRTEDGGKSWKKIKAIGMGYSELFYQNGTVYLLSFGRINRSTDFGISWKSTLTIEGSPGRSLSFSGSSGIIAGLAGMCAFTADGGKTWFPSTQDEQTMFIASQMINLTEGYIGGSNNTLLKTIDGGKSWNPELMAKLFDIFDMALVGDKLYVVGKNGGIIWKTVK